jgi:predicted dehydrogenase
MRAPRIVVVGTGSAGRRHAKNLRQLGAEVFCVDPREDRRAQAARELPGLAGTYASLAEAMEGTARFDGGVIASPPSAHVEQAMALMERGMPLLLEKPIAPDLASALKLEQAARTSQAPVLLGYTYRWWPPLLEMKRRVAEGAVGPVRHARFVMSAHLADWHPWEPYQDFFMARRELGGGALLDESHFLDLMIWCFGMPESLTGRVERLSALEITTDDNVDLIAAYPDGLRVTIHLDLFGRPHEKVVTVVGEQGTLQCAFAPDAVRWSSTAGGGWQEQPFSCERNDMFLAEAKEFLSLTKGPAGGTPSCTIEDGIRVLQCVEAARLSTQEERTVRVEPCLKAAAS